MAKWLDVQILLPRLILEFPLGREFETLEKCFKVYALKYLVKEGLFGIHVARGLTTLETIGGGFRRTLN